MKAVVYRHYGIDGQLLYVGTTITAFGRLRRHIDTSRWKAEIAQVEITHYATKEEARDAEKHAIQSEHPLFNVRHNQPPKVKTKKAKLPFVHPGSYMTKQEAHDWAGGTGALAEKLGITPSAVSQWADIPELQQHRLWRLSAGKLLIDRKYDTSKQGDSK